MRRSIIFLLILSIAALFVISGCQKEAVGQRIGSIPEVQEYGDKCPGKCKVYNDETSSIYYVNCVIGAPANNCGCPWLPEYTRVISSNCGEIS